MIITDFFRYDDDICIDCAKQCGVKYGTVRLPEDGDFDITDFSHWQKLYDGFINKGITPIVIEPLPNCLHDHIKAGDSKRDECIEKVKIMLSYMDKLNIRTLCFNFMAYVGWTRTSSDIKERGGAFVTGFNTEDYKPTNDVITANQLWENYEYFIRSVIPYAEKYNIKLALHPDDPPLEKLGNVERIMISPENIIRAVNIVESKNLGVTFCQATYKMMGADLDTLIPQLKDKIFFVHFRNVAGNKNNFRETFHDNGDIEMAKIMKLYKSCGIDAPIRVDHVPLLKGEQQNGVAGYTALGRLFAIGYLKGILEAIDNEY